MMGVTADVGSGPNLPFSCYVTMGFSVLICQRITMTQPPGGTGSQAQPLPSLLTSGTQL